MNKDEKILNKTLANQIQQYVKMTRRWAPGEGLKGWVCRRHVSAIHIPLAMRGGDDMSSSCVPRRTRWALPGSEA